MLIFRPKIKDFASEPDITFMADVKVVETSKYWFVFDKDFIKMLSKASFSML
jgi:hypothetical protein